MTDGTPLRVGIIGVGWGAHVQVPGFRAAKGFEPVALCARTPERLERVVLASQSSAPGALDVRPRPGRRIAP